MFSEIRTAVRSALELAELALVRANRFYAIFPTPLTPNILTQPLIQIDPQNGSDKNTGLPGAPLKTWREYWRRMCVASAPFVEVTLTDVNQTVQFLSSQLDDTDVVSRSMVIGTNATHTILGGFDGPPLQAGTFTAWTSLNAPANIPNQGTDSALPAANSWTALESSIIVDITAGHSLAWVTSDLGAKKALLSYFCAPFAAGQQTLQRPTYVNSQAPGDSYEVRKLIRICWGGDSVRGLCTDTPEVPPFTTTTNAYMKQLDCSLPNAGIVNDQVTIFADHVCGWVAIECRFEAEVWADLDLCTMVNCTATFTQCHAGSELFVWGGMCNTDGGGWEAALGGEIELENHVLDGFGTIINATRGGQTTLFGLGLFGASWVQLQDPFAAVTIVDVAAAVWGTTTGCPFASPGLGDLFTIAGKDALLFRTPLNATVNVTVPGATFSFCVNNPAYPFDPVTHAYLTARATTIANFVATTGTGGFHGNAFDPMSGAFVGQWI